MFLSTDYVFDGAKRSPYETTDPRNPTSVYGESKARAEERLLEILPEVCIVRTSWLFGRAGKCFPATILKLASTHPEKVKELSDLYDAWAKRCNVVPFGTLPPDRPVTPAPESAARTAVSDD